MRGLVLVAALLFFSPLQAAVNWRVLPDASRLGFVATQQGGEFEGYFRGFEATMVFAPNDLANSRFDVTIDVASVDTGSRQRDRTLPESDWFNTEEYPQARFVTSEIRRADDSDYEAVGTLTIRGNSREIVLPFSWRIDGDSAAMDGEVEIDRTDFGVGQGEWASGDTVGRTVRVQVDLELRRQAPN